MGVMICLWSPANHMAAIRACKSNELVIRWELSYWPSVSPLKCNNEEEKRKVRRRFVVGEDFCRNMMIFSIFFIFVVFFPFFSFLSYFYHFFLIFFSFIFYFYHFFHFFPLHFHFSLLFPHFFTNKFANKKVYALNFVYFSRYNHEYSSKILS